jgi:hypothetical protein
MTADSQFVTLNSGDVAQMSGQTQNNNLAVQATPAEQPLWSAGPAPSLACAGGDSLTVANTAVIVPGTDDFTIFAVHKGTQQATFQTVFGHTVNGTAANEPGSIGWSYYWNNTKLYPQVHLRMGAASIAVNANTATYAGVLICVLTTIDRDGLISLFVNGVAKGTADATVGVPANADIPLPGGFPMFIGGDAVGGDGVFGDIYECGFVRGIPSTAELNQLGAYWAARYGITWEPIA